MFEVVTPVFAMPIGRPRSPRGLRCVLISPIEGNRGGVLMQPGRRDGIDLQGFEGDRAKYRVEIGRRLILDSRVAELRIVYTDDISFHDP